MDRRDGELGLGDRVVPIGEHFIRSGYAWIGYFGAASGRERAEGMEPGSFTRLENRQRRALVRWRDASP